MASERVGNAIPPILRLLFRRRGAGCCGFDNVAVFEAAQPEGRARHDLACLGQIVSGFGVADFQTVRRPHKHGCGIRHTYSVAAGGNSTRLCISMLPSAVATSQPEQPSRKSSISAVKTGA